jgi:hypothetical protein
MGILIILIGLTIGYFGYRLKYAKPQYQFEKTTSGRTVKFLDYGESKRHERNKVIGILLIFLTVLILGIGILVMVFVNK